jgi:hypothetical protein
MPDRIPTAAKIKGGVILVRLEQEVDLIIIDQKRKRNKEWTWVNVRPPCLNFK